MKILRKRNIKQFGAVVVQASDKALAGILSFATDIPFHRWVYDISLVKARGGEFVCFRSGAKLCYSTDSGEFYIYGYHYAGRDIDAAIEQLKMGHALYSADKHLGKMFGLMSQQKRPTLRHKLDYDNMCLT
jgi:hypothetical protein